MFEVHQEKFELPTTLELATSKKELTSDAMKRICDWIVSQEVPSDVTVCVGSTSFSIHKFPIVSKCGYIKKLLLDSKHIDDSVVEIPEIPGGPAGFELAAKFCYETDIDLCTENIAMARCVAEYLEMTEEYASGNLVSITEAYLDDMGLRNLSCAVSILQSSVNLLPISEKEIFGKSKKNLDPGQEHEKRVVLETIVGLLPRERNAISISFLSMLLRAAKCLDTTVACRIDLEKRMASQLSQAVLDDILIPSFCFDGDTLFDVDTVQQIMSNYIEDNSMESCGEDSVSPMERDKENIGMLMESFLAKIASDRNLMVSRFISFAECIPADLRVTDDGMYRAIDIYLKAHSTISDMDRKKVCSLMDCQKLSREARAHASQNERLPVQTVVQVLYYEQKRLQESESPNHMISNGTPKSQNSLSDEITSLRKENQELKFELLKMKTRLKEIETSTTANKPARVNNASRTTTSATKPPLPGKPPLPKKSLISTVTKKLGKITPFLHADGFLPSSTRGRNKPDKDRRHSVS